MTSAAAASDVTDGPVLTLINKRIRNLKKKLNRIAQLEESISQGKSVKNKEQEELLKSKPAIVAAVDELEKFRQPLSVAIDEETNLAIQQRKEAPNNGKEIGGDNLVKTLDHEENEAALNSDLDVEDLMKLLYFGNMFDVKSQSDFSSIMLTRTHERNCCLTYDYVTDDAAFMLKERDLDLISMMGSLLISRPMDSSLSHQNALQRCIDHAKLWLANSKQPIDSNSDVTYASLREKLARIVRSEYFRITPEMKAPADVAAGSYGFQVPVQVESLVAQHEQKEDDVTNLHRNETGEDQSNLVEDPLKQQAEAAENSVDMPVETYSNGADSKEQFVPRRNYHNQRGGGRNGGGGGGGRRSGYGNGRGGRSGGRGGPYQNGGRSNQFNDQPGNYYPRNYHGGGRGRGGRGGGGGHYSNGGNHHAPSGVEVAES